MGVTSARPGRLFTDPRHGKRSLPGPAPARVETDGKHFTRAGRPRLIKGVTYGSFKRRLDGALYPPTEVVERDLRAMAEAGVNTVRLYTTPPGDLLDAADALGLGLIVGIDYHDWRMEPATNRSARRRIARAARRELDRALETCVGHASVLAIAVGNEVPVDLVRLHGTRHVEDTLNELIERVHTFCPDLLATYVNFPTTEFLEIESQDFVSFNVFLEDPEALRRYLRHLQIVAGPKPLVLTELGLAGDIHGEATQAQSVASQLTIATETGCAGACVFSWTDEWAVDDEPVDGWGFGLTTSERAAKPALGAFSNWTSRPLGDLRPLWPRISVVVCAHNEEATIEECLTSLAETDYPDLEVIVCVDGSTDRTFEIASRFPFQVYDLPHGGLSRARNRGLAAASGEITAYLDADAACHPYWPYYLALSLEDPEIVATGGPNLPFPSAGLVEEAVALSPGDPVEVLIGDDRAEHVPGCNMAFRTEELEAAGGFNVACTVAGDDVDICWRLLDRQRQIGFAPAAQVRHHRRDRIGRYLRQQLGYGRAEKMLSGAHPHRYNGLGQAMWTGFVYTKARLLPSLLAPVVYHGYQGMAPFQSIQGRPAQAAIGWVGARLPLLLPLAIGGLVLAPMDRAWLALPVVSLLVLALYALSVGLGLRSRGGDAPSRRVRGLAGLLHVAQPFARLWGRLRGKPLEPVDRPVSWQGDRSRWLQVLKRRLEIAGVRTTVGGPTDDWDLEARHGIFLTARISTAVVWNWEPRWRVRWRPRGGALAWLAAGVSALYLGATAAGAVLLGGGALALLELLSLRRAIIVALRASTRGAGEGEEPVVETTPSRPTLVGESPEPLLFERSAFSTRDVIPAVQKAHRR